MSLASCSKTYCPDLVLPKLSDAGSTMTERRTGSPFSMTAPVTGFRQTHRTFCVRLRWCFFMPSLHSVPPSGPITRRASSRTLAASSAQRRSTGPAACFREQGEYVGPAACTARTNSLKHGRPASRKGIPLVAIKRIRALSAFSAGVAPVSIRSMCCKRLCSDSLVSCNDFRFFARLSSAATNVSAPAESFGIG